MCTQHRTAPTLGSWRNIAMLCVLVAGCAQHIYSPPARGMPLESVRVAPIGGHLVVAEGGASSALFGPDVLAATARYRTGIAPDLELQAEATVIALVNDDNAAATHRNAYSARFGLKHQLSSWCALGAGFGGGASAAGGFASPDLLAVFAYENRYIVPFAAVRGFTSSPLAPRRVDLGDESFADEPARVFDTPRFTEGLALSIGIRVPLRTSDELEHSFYIGVTATHLRDRYNALTLLGLGAGIELKLWQ